MTKPLGSFGGGGPWPKCGARGLIALFCCLAVHTLPSAAHGTDVVLDASEAEALLAILDTKASGTAVADADWARLWGSEPYVRLKRREASMNRAFTDEEFREFVLSDELAGRAAALRTTLADWREVDLSSALARARAYLPEDATIRATIYPVIKPRTNSFVFEIDSDPAIFLHLDPEISAAKLENTLAHELHHIGFGGNCPTPAAEREIEALPAEVSWAVQRLGAFGEGFAMLAAAGGPSVHPHAVSDADERARWDRDMAAFDRDFRRVQEFLEGSLDGSLVGEERDAAFRSFYGEQGPWYTVGWKMAVTIEQQLGRDALLGAFCDTRELLPAYNRAARQANTSLAEPLPLWPDDLLRALGPAAAPGS